MGTWLSSAPPGISALERPIRPADPALLPQRDHAMSVFGHPRMDSEMILQARVHLDCNERSIVTTASRAEPGRSSHALRMTAKSSSKASELSARCAPAMLRPSPSFDPCCPAAVRPLHMGQTATPSACPTCDPL